MAGEQRAIAEALNISEATVSRSLKNHPRISAVTRARVAEVAVRMGLRPRGTDAVEGMSKPPGDRKSSGMIHLGTLCRGSSASGKPQDIVALRLIQGMSLAARANRATLHIEFLSPHEFDRLDDPRMWPTVIQERIISGVAIFADLKPSAVEVLSKHLPCVQFVAPGSRSVADSVTEDNVRAVGQLFDHLQGLGHKQIGMADFGYDSPSARSRLVGYMQALVNRNMPYHPDDCRLPVGKLPISAADSEVQRAASVADHVIGRMTQGVRAWICVNDNFGYQLVEQLKLRGISVPKDVSVCGFDNFDPPEGMPKLTTMETPYEAVGRAAVRRLMLRATERDGEPVHIMFGCKLIEGESTGAI
jgi:DNA-binding LacI/PurR family transcriptional regulator